MRTQPVLTDFRSVLPKYRIDQAASLKWLAKLHANNQQNIERIERMIERVGCGPGDIDFRGHSVDEAAHGQSSDTVSQPIYDLTLHPQGGSTDQRTSLYESLAFAALKQLYDDPPSKRSAPQDLIHVTCTGYSAPSPAQRLVVDKGWSTHTRVTHAYHMGCYAALPAIRIAAGFIASSSANDHEVDIAHTELSTLNLDPSELTVEQIIIQSLFSDGFIRYRVSGHSDAPGFDVLATHEILTQGTADDMRWSSGSHGMRMKLSRNIPEILARNVRGFIGLLCDRANLHSARHRKALFAVHPGGPKIIDSVQDAAKLSDEQLWHSREVLRLHGNMSSATLPHIWQSVLMDNSIATETPVVSLAFGPGLTLSGCVLRKRT